MPPCSSIISMTCVYAMLMWLLILGINAGQKSIISWKHFQGKVLIFLCFCNPKNAPQKIFFKCLAPTKKRKKKRKIKHTIYLDLPSMHLALMKVANLFYYLTYFCYYLWISLHFLILFISLTVLFQLTFTFIYSTFSKKFWVSTK